MTMTTTTTSGAVVLGFPSLSCIQKIRDGANPPPPRDHDRFDLGLARAERTTYKFLDFFDQLTLIGFEVIILLITFGN